MKTCTFTKPSTGYPMDDLQQRIMEVVLNLHNDVGSIEQVSETLFRMFELAFPYATEKELSDFTKVQGALRCINQLISENSEAFELFLKEHSDYKIC